MDSNQSTAVNSIQELLAMHATFKEACEKMQGNAAAGDLISKLKTTADQSDRHIKGLMNELSQFGDAVSGEVDRDNTFHQIWKDSLSTVQAMDAPQLSQTFEKLHDSLRNKYRELIGSPTEMPGTLHDLLTKQEEELA